MSITIKIHESKWSVTLSKGSSTDQILYHANLFLAFLDMGHLFEDYFLLPKLEFYYIDNSYLFFGTRGRGHVWFSLKLYLLWVLNTDRYLDF